MSDLADKILDSVFPRPSPSTRLSIRGRGTTSARSDDTKDKLPHTGTTVLAFKYKNGIMFAADRKTSGGYFSIFSLEAIKIEQIAPRTVVGCAGLVADSQFIKEVLEETNSGFNSRYGFTLSVEGQVNYLVNLCRNFRFYVDPLSMGLEIQAVIGGMDFSGDFEIFEISGEGSFYKKDFTVVGSGTDHAMGVLKENRKNLIGRSLNLRESMLVAVKAIYRAGEADSGTSDIRVATPNIAVITKSGVKFIKTENVKKVVDRVLEKEV
ncbi:MAG TPA: hypothetical protein VJC06_01730 [Candidatus Paceibacterota bacterium]